MTPLERIARTNRVGAVALQPLDDAGLAGEPHGVYRVKVYGFDGRDLTEARVSFTVLSPGLLIRSLQQIGLN